MIHTPLPNQSHTPGRFNGSSKRGLRQGPTVTKTPMGTCTPGRRALGDISINRQNQSETPVEIGQKKQFSKTPLRPVGALEPSHSALFQFQPQTRPKVTFSLTALACAKKNFDVDDSIEQPYGRTYNEQLDLSRDDDGVLSLDGLDTFRKKQEGWRRSFQNRVNDEFMKKESSREVTLEAEIISLVDDEGKFSE